MEKSDLNHVDVDSDMRRRIIALVAFYRLSIVTALVFGSFWLTTGMAVDAIIAVPSVSIFYLIYTLFFIVIRSRITSHWARLYFLVDLFFFVVFMHFLGGVNTALGILFIIFILSVSAIVSVRDAVALAAASSLLILGEQTYRYFMSDVGFGDFARTGLLGMVYFISAVAISSFARLARESRDLADQASVDLKNMAELNEYIIQRMGSGVIVVDELDNITLTNDAAWYLLGFQQTTAIEQLEHISAPLYEQLRNWRRHHYEEGRTLNITGSADIVPRFIGLGSGRDKGVLILLEDSSLLNQQAQHLKLTAMGRLTASIAHEIRNPLGAISHAAQLLTESQDLAKPDRRLVEIIQQNSARTNNVIENIMQLTRKDKASPETILLKPWLVEFIEEIVRNNKLEIEQIHWGVEPENLKIEFDPGHLHQILSNLCQNAIRHGLEASTRKYIEIRVSHNADSRGPVLEVIDYGPGIEPEIARQIFEPFYTTATKGTGLGLYIARELASVNQAKLDYVPVPSGGSCFRVTFKDN